MLIWPIIIIAVAILVLVLSQDGVSINGASEDMRFLFFAVLGAGAVVAGLGGLFVKGGRRTMVSSAVMLGLVAGLTVAFIFRYEATNMLARTGVMPNAAPTRVWGQETLYRGWDGHYTASAEVNGVRMKLLIDTGASMVLIPYEEAQALGVDPEELNFSIPVTTANGRSSVAPIMLDGIRINTIYVRNVRAAVAQPGRLKTALLGISFLDRIYEFTFRGSELTLRQSPDNG